MSFELLSEPIRRYVRDRRWPSLRPIQAAAISEILTTDCHYILASRTASGKTEAAFLPILSKVNFREQGVQVLYVSPLIALINDQFQRVEELCKYLDVKVTKWHGEANATDKKNLVSAPEGVVLITPESLEAMFVNAPHKSKVLFGNLKFVVVDEIHSFIGTDRGIHLMSLLSRLNKLSEAGFRFVGLSATIGDYTEAKRFTGDEGRTKVLLDSTGKEMLTTFHYFEGGTPELPLPLLKDIYRQAHITKALIFPNSRGRAEEIAVKLRKIAERVNGHLNYFSHHSSVDKEVREYVEHFAKNNRGQPFSIVCTSTLELGIDIGSVEKVFQVDATNSIASLIQRVGRSGRREGEQSKLLLYATDPWNLLQSLACWTLYKEGFIEKVRNSPRPYDVLLHQALSITKELSGCEKEVLIEKLCTNHAFAQVSKENVLEIIEELIERNWLESIHRELIIGTEGEYIVNSREFYSMFKTDPNFKVISAGKTIGEIPLSPQVQEDANVLLAARIWKIKYVDVRAKRIEVIPANDGKAPIFFGGGGIVDQKVREKMLKLLFEESVIPELDEESQEALRELRQDFKIFTLTDLNQQRPALSKNLGTVFFTFAGTKINRSLGFLLAQRGIKFTCDERQSSFTLTMPFSQGKEIFKNLQTEVKNIDKLLMKALENDESLIDFTKWGKGLPKHLQSEILKERYYDFEGATKYLNEIILVSNEPL